LTHLSRVRKTDAGRIALPGRDDLPARNVAVGREAKADFGKDASIDGYA
jgi:hypothetical protein